MFCVDIPPGGSKEALEMAAEIHDVDQPMRATYTMRKPANTSTL